jgi:hypothetical protein
MRETGGKERNRDKNGFWVDDGSADSWGGVYANARRVNYGFSVSKWDLEEEGRWWFEEGSRWR